AKGIYGGFYTQEEIREIIRYAADRFITVVPEIEMPGHTSEVFAAFPQYSCKRKKLSVAPGGYWPNLDIFCAGNDQTFEFLEDILDEVCDLFPSEYIHIGGDEANKTFWKECPKCQKRIADEDLKDENELQSWFIRRIEKFLLSKGKKLIGWDEISEGGLTKDATVMCWRGDGVDAVKNAVSNGNKAVMCPNFFLYFDWKQREKESEQGAFGVTTLKKVYSYDPVPQDIPEEQQNLILGAQGNVWTEFMTNPQEVEYMALPRMCALSEIVWTKQKSRNWKDFQKRMESYLKILERKDINFCKS
ncbi:MAG: family 20 glycosylhydrolase, partial [Candidatus Cloacimonetes bacterium]|nr:family 20 glycosylhydrolase [Candidatus Cloacimonadota bacterium]